MNLQFDILWFDDDPEFLGSLDLEPFEATVRSWGFKMDVVFVNTPADFAKQDPDRFDLIVVDYNLGGQEHGEDFIKRIRDHRAYTEIIFYSANAQVDLFEAIRAKQLEGVFVANKVGILEKLERVAHQAVHKVLDLNNMRGMVMAEVGDIDKTFEAILKLGVPALKEEELIEIFNNFHKRAVDYGEGFLKKVGEFKSAPSIEKMLVLCDSYKRWTAFRSLMKRLPALAEFKVGDYNADVLKPRNHLAHGTPEQTADGYIFRHDGGEYVFDEKGSLALRTTILGYSDTFDAILARLSGAAASA
jgi:hypothetical protein